MVLGGSCGFWWFLIVLCGSWGFLAFFVVVQGDLGVVWCFFLKFLLIFSGS